MSVGLSRDFKRATLTNETTAAATGRPLSRQTSKSKPVSGAQLILMKLQRQLADGVSLTRLLRAERGGASRARD